MPSFAIIIKKRKQLGIDFGLAPPPTPSGIRELAQLLSLSEHQLSLRQNEENYHFTIIVEMLQEEHVARSRHIDKGEFSLLYYDVIISFSAPFPLQKRSLPIILSS